MSTADSTIATTVRGLAAARGMTHQDVAAAVGMKQPTFDRRLARGGWTIDEADRLAQIFGISLDELTTGLGGQLLADAE